MRRGHDNFDIMDLHKVMSRNIRRQAFHALRGRWCSPRQKQNDYKGVHFRAVKSLLSCRLFCLVHTLSLLKH